MGAWPRYPVGLRLLLVALMLGLAVGAGFMAELILRQTELECGPASGGQAPCDLIETWPFDLERRTPLSPVVRARVRPDGRGNRQLFLTHADRSVSIHKGVGARGDRADTVALRLRDHLQAGGATARFALRGSVPILGWIVLFGVGGGALLMIPHFFGWLRVEVGPRVRVVKDRWPLPRLIRELDPSTAQVGFRTMNFRGAETTELLLEDGTESVRLGMGFSDPFAAEVRARELRDLLQSDPTGRRADRISGPE